MTQPLIDVCVGAFVMLAGIVSGTVLHTRWIDRKLAKKKGTP